MSQFISLKILNKIGKDKYKLLEVEYSSNNKIKLHKLNPYNPNKVEFICNNCNKSYSTNIQTWLEKKNEFGKCSHKKIYSVHEENKILDIWDYSKNIISPKDVTSGSAKKAYFICKKCNSSLFVSISQMSKAFEKKLNGCKYCSGNSVNETNSFAAIYKDFSKNIISPNPNNYTFGSHTKCIAKCKTCNNEYSSSFYILTKSIKLGNNGCPYCSGLKISKTTSIGSKFPDIAKNIIGDPFKLSIKDKFMFKCFSCNYIHETDIKHIKQTCRYCSRISVNENNNITKTHPEILEYWDYEKNKIKPENHLYGSRNKVFIKCKECFNSRKKFTYDIKDNLCRYCAMNSVSKVEKEWLDSLSIPIECRQIILKVNNKTIYVDALYNNTIYEFNGDFWHGNPNKYNPNEINKISKKTFGELYNKTLEKEKFLKENGYDVISIWESDWKLIKKNNIYIYNIKSMSLINKLYNFYIKKASIENDMANRIMYSLITSNASPNELYYSNRIVNEDALDLAVQGIDNIIKYGSISVLHELKYLDQDILDYNNIDSNEISKDIENNKYSSILIFLKKSNEFVCK